MALGARRGAVVGMVMRQGLFVAVAGLLAGCLLAGLLAAFVTRFVDEVLYSVSAADPLSWLAAAALLLTVSAFANLIPAWRVSASIRQKRCVSGQ